MSMFLTLPWNTSVLATDLRAHPSPQPPVTSQELSGQQKTPAGGGLSCHGPEATRWGPKPLDIEVRLCLGTGAPKGVM